MTKRAYNALPTRFEDDRHGAIVEGFRRHGYQIVDGYGAPRSPDDILLTWTIHRGMKERRRDEFEARGGRVLVCEESYIKMPRGEKHIALAWHEHQGGGNWYVGGADRWRDFGIEPKPWRTVRDDQYILVREQRGIGSSVQACPAGWLESTVESLRALSSREIRVRLHPKRDPDKTPDSERHAGAYALVSWNSSQITGALIAGVPVIACAPYCIHDGAVNRGLKEIQSLTLFDREPSLVRAAWAQWSLSEIRNGDAASYLLPVE